MSEVAALPLEKLPSFSATISAANAHSELNAPYLGISLGEAVGVLVLILGVHLASYYNYLLFHSAAELFSIFIALTISIIVINCWKSVRNQYVLFIGVAYLFLGLLDVLPLLSKIPHSKWTSRQDRPVRQTLARYHQ